MLSGVQAILRLGPGDSPIGIAAWRDFCDRRGLLAAAHVPNDAIRHGDGLRASFGASCATVYRRAPGPDDAGPILAAATELGFLGLASGCGPARVAELAAAARAAFGGGLTATPEVARHLPGCAG